MAKKILTVDDSASIRQMVSFTLKSAGYEVVEAADGNQGLAKAQTARFDLVLTDPPYGIGFAAQPGNYKRKAGATPQGVASTDQLERW